jgi:hypothetical protein
VINIRLCRDDDRAAILAIVNAAAEAYRGVIPVDRWHEPYMPLAELDREIASGVVFWGHEKDGVLLCVMGFRKILLLKTYWSIPDRQVDTSVVLANPPFDEVIT